MEKLDGASMNLVQENLKKLKEIFPEIFIEGRIDFDLLRQICNGGGVQDLVDSKERYSLTWNGKTRARQIAQEVSTGTLRPAKEESKNWNNTENIYIEGDNLEVLKLLQKSYHGKIKMIYIDPPYNTGKDFVYKDNFKDNIENYKGITGQINKEGIKLTTNTETNGRYHSDWLNMMYPRLKLARNLLTDDGVIFISIDDNEQANLKKICDEIFGEENIEQMIWNKEAEGSSGTLKVTQRFRKNHEYVLILYKMKEITEFKKINEALIGRENELQTANLAVNIEKEDKNHKNYYKIMNPLGDEFLRQWKWSKEEVDKLISENLIYWGSDGHKQPRLIIPTDERRTTYLLSILNYGGTTVGRKDFEEIMGNRIEFSYPKPIILLKKILDTVTNGEENDIILDFFSGSSTTAHSVIQLNAEDGGSRRYIMVQLPEVCDESSEAYKAGYKNICEIGKERMRRAGEKIKLDESLPLENREKLDIGFKVFKLDTSNIKGWDTNTEDLQQTLLDSMENIKSDRNSLDVLYEILLKYGLDLNIPIEENKDFYSIGGGSLLVSLNKEINDEIINSICKEYKNLLEIDKEFKTTVILRDNSFKNDVDKTNAIKKLEQVGINEIRSI